MADHVTQRAPAQQSYQALDVILLADDSSESAAVEEFLRVQQVAYRQQYSPGTYGDRPAILVRGHERKLAGFSQIKQFFTTTPGRPASQSG